MALNAAGLVTRAASFATDFPHLMVRNASGVDQLTNRVHMTDGTRVTITGTNPITITVVVSGSDFIGLPGTSYDVQAFTGASGGAVQGTWVASSEETVNSAGSKITITFTHTEV